MNFSLYFIITFIVGIISYCLNWNSLCNIDPNCSVDILNTSNKLLFTSSIVLSALSFISIFKTKEIIVFYRFIFLFIALCFIVLSIINLVNGKQIKNFPKTTTPATTPIKSVENIYIECVSNITSVLNLLIGIFIGILTVYYLKNEIFNYFSNI